MLFGREMHPGKGLGIYYSIAAFHSKCASPKLLLLPFSSAVCRQNPNRAVNISRNVSLLCYSMGRGFTKKSKWDPRRQRRSIWIKSATEYDPLGIWSLIADLWTRILVLVFGWISLVGRTHLYSYVDNNPNIRLFRPNSCEWICWAIVGPSIDIYIVRTTIEVCVQYSSVHRK